MSLNRLLKLGEPEKKPVENDSQFPKCYKLVRLENEILLFSLTLNFKSRVRYFIDQWTYPKEGCGPLSICSTIESAKEHADLLKTFWREEANKVHLFECIYEPSSIEDLWGFNDKGNPVKQKGPNVLGFLTAKRVKLIKEIPLWT